MKWNLVDASEDPDDFFIRVLPRDGGAYHPRYALVRAALAQGILLRAGAKRSLPAL